MKEISIHLLGGLKVGDALYWSLVGEVLNPLTMFNDRLSRVYTRVESSCKAGQNVLD